MFTDRFAPPPVEPQAHGQLDYWLRRAEEEAIAAIRAPHPVASDRHDQMAHAYSALALTILGSSSAG